MYVNIILSCLDVQVEGAICSICYVFCCEWVESTTVDDCNVLDRRGGLPHFHGVGGVGVGWMITFFGLAHMLDATELLTFSGLASMLDATHDNVCGHVFL